MDERNMEELEMDEEASVITLNDENGNEVDFEFLDLIEYEGVEYVVLLPVDEESNEVVILKVEPIEGNEDEEAYVSVGDEALLIKLFEIFKERFADIFTFEE